MCIMFVLKGDYISSSLAIVLSYTPRLVMTGGLYWLEGIDYSQSSP